MLDCTISRIYRIDIVCEARAASFFWNHPGSRSTPRIGTRSAAVRRVLQPSRWRRRVPWHTMPSIRRWHSAPPSGARRQHSCLPVLSRCLYHLRQAVVHAERTPTESRQVRSALDGHSDTVEIGVIFEVRISRGGLLPVTDSMRVLGVTLDRRPTFDNHASAVARSCNYHARAIRHIQHLLTLNLAQTLACSLILSRIDYCNSVLHGAPSSTIQKFQRVQNNAAPIVLQAPRRSDVNSLLQTLHWLAVEQRINYKLAVLTFKTQHTSSPQYLSQHIRCAPMHATLDRRPSHCCACHFDGHHLPDDRSALPHLWLATHCHLPY